MAEIDRKYVDVGTSSGYGTTQYGFTTTIGNIADTANGTRNTVWSGATGADVTSCQYLIAGGTAYSVIFAVDVQGLSSSIFDSMTIGSQTYYSADASFQTNSGYSSWTWSTTSTNPFGTTSGADVLVIWDDGVTGFTGTAPTISSVTDNNAAAASVTSTVNLSSNGSGGTLKYAMTTTNSVPASGWQTSSTFTQPRGTTRYFWASQAENTANSYDGGEAHAVGYLSPDSTITTIANQTISNAATSFDVTIANGSTNTTYQIRLGAYGGTIVGSRTGNGTITVTDVPIDNSTRTYYVTCFRTAATGGNESSITNIQTFTVTTEEALTPPVISSVTHDDASAASVTATVNLSSVGSAGTGLKYAQTTTNAVPATGWQTSASFTQARGTTRYYWASRDEDSTGAYSSSTSLAVGYIAPDTVVTATNAAIGTSQTTASTTISGCTVGETYAVRVNNGSTNLATNTATSSTVVISFSSSLPAPGATSTYEIFSSRPTNLGGDGLYDATNDTFTVTRAADNVPDPFTFTDVTGVAQNTTQTSNTITIAGMTAGTSVGVTISGGTYSKNGAAYVSTATTAVNGDTFAVRHVSGTDFDVSVSTTLSVGTTSDTFTSTTAAFGGATHYVEVAGETEIVGDVFVEWSGAGSSSSAVTAAYKLAPGDRVGFRWGGFTTATELPVTVSGFASTHWTDTTSITIPITQTSTYTYKYVSSTIPTSTVDGVTATATSQGYSRSITRYFVGTSVAPDLTVTLASNAIEITSADTSHSITIQEASPNTNSSITEYRVIDEFGGVHESRTGPGAITVTDVPPNDGFPKYYSVQGRITTANGGNNAWYAVSGTTYYVVASSNAATNDPTIDAYGLAIYDHNGTAVTSFTAGHTVLRDLVSFTTTLSSSGYRDVDTGIVGITANNCVISLQGFGITGAGTTLNVPTTFIVGANGNTYVRLGKYASASPPTVKVTVSQYAGNTLGAAVDSYGLEIRNNNNTVVIDESSTVYSVREIITLNPSASNITLSSGDYANYITVELTAGRYPASGGLPIPALGCDKSYLLSPPSIYGTHPDGSYRTVVVWIPKVSSPQSYKLALLVPATNTTPEYYGGAASDYGLVINDSSGNTKWRSDWRQAVVNNVIAANQFTEGVNQNGDRDVTTGYDGVPPVVPTGEDAPVDLQTVGEVISFSNLNEMDPKNTYVIGSAAVGYVEYYSGDWYIDFEVQGQAGGGKHRPAVQITGFNSASITMWRYSDGGSPPTGYSDFARNPASYHAEGNFVLVRIV